MSNITTLSNLIAILSDSDLKDAMTHVDWTAAYEDTLEGLEDVMPFRIKDVEEEVVLVYILQIYSFGVDEKGRLVRTDDDVWVNGEWVDGSDLID